MTLRHFPSITAILLLTGSSLSSYAQETTMIDSIDAPTVRTELVAPDRVEIDSAATTEEIEAEDFLHYPAGLEYGEFRGLFGVSITILPKILVEDQIRQSPLVTGQLRFGLPLNFSVEGALSTNIIANYVTLGPRWGLDFGRFAFGLSAKLGYWYGFAPIEGFDIVATSWMNIPGVEFGLRLDEVRTTLRAEALIVTALRITSDDIETRTSKNEVAGYALDFRIEQPFWGNSSTALGLRLNYSKTMYQAWLAFSTLDVYQIYPEFTIALLF